MIDEVEEINTDDNKDTRLNKLSPLFILINVVIKSIIPLAFGVFTYGASKYSNSIVIGAGIFILAFSVLQYWYYRYWIKDEKIEIKEGILFKSNRKVPYTRIQNVNVSQNPLERILKVATLQLESASGGKPEAVMRVVDLDVVEEIKQKVKKSNGQNFETVNNEAETREAKENKPLHEIPTKDVIKYGIISQKGMFFGAILFGFLAQNQGLMTTIVKFLDRFYFDLPDFTKITFAEGIIYVLVIGVVMFVFLQLLSILWALMKFYDFKIEKQGDRLQARMGLLSKVAATIPLKKIQLYRISENPLHKFFKARTITIETAGGVNTDNSGIVMRWLAPYINTKKVKSFINAIEHKIKLGSVEWKLIPKRAWKRVLKRSLISLSFVYFILIIITQLPWFTIKVYAWFLMVAMIPITFIYAKKYVKKTAYYIDDDIISFKSGVWFGKQSFVKISKIQTVEILESPFDRWNKMATLEIDTAGSNPLLHHVKIPYLEIADAYQLQAFIQKRLDETEFNW